MEKENNVPNAKQYDLEILGIDPNAKKGFPNILIDLMLVFLVFTSIIFVLTYGSYITSKFYPYATKIIGAAMATLGGLTNFFSEESLKKFEAYIAKFFEAIYNTVKDNFKRSVSFSDKKINEVVVSWTISIFMNAFFIASIGLIMGWWNESIAIDLIKALMVLSFYAALLNITSDISMWSDKVDYKVFGNLILFYPLLVCYSMYFYPFGDSIRLAIAFPIMINVILIWICLMGMGYFHRKYLWITCWIIFKILTWPEIIFNTLPRLISLIFYFPFFLIAKALLATKRKPLLVMIGTFGGIILALL